jgi:serine/threonine protein phosphatase PrpC
VPVVICDPEIIAHTLGAEDDVLLLACDGIFDVFSSQEAIDYTRAQLEQLGTGAAGAGGAGGVEGGEGGDGGESCKVEEGGGASELHGVCARLVHEAIEVRMSYDNVTALVVQLKCS